GLEQLVHVPTQCHDRGRGRGIRGEAGRRIPYERVRRTRELGNRRVQSQQLEVDELDARQLPDGGVDVARQAEVDDEQSVTGGDVGDVGDGDRVPRGARHDDIGVCDGGGELALGAHAVLRREHRGAAGGRVHA